MVKIEIEKHAFTKAGIFSTVLGGAIKMFAVTGLLFLDPVSNITLFLAVLLVVTDIVRHGLNESIKA